MKKSKWILVTVLLVLAAVTAWVIWLDAGLTAEGQTVLQQLHEIGRKNLTKETVQLTKDFKAILRARPVTALIAALIYGIVAALVLMVGKAPQVPQHVSQEEAARLRDEMEEEYLRDDMLVFPSDTDEPEEEGTFYGFSEPMSMYRNLFIKEKPLPEGTYFCDFVMENCFGQRARTDLVELYWDGTEWQCPEWGTHKCRTLCGTDQLGRENRLYGIYH